MDIRLVLRNLCLKCHWWEGVSLSHEAREIRPLKIAENIKMESLFGLFLPLWVAARVNGQGTIDIFINNLVDTFKLTSPTIIYDEEVPEICYNSPRVLCVSLSDPIEENEGMFSRNAYRYVDASAHSC